MPKKPPKTFVKKSYSFSCSFYGVYTVHKILSPKVLVALAHKDQTAFSDSCWDFIVQRKREPQPSAALGAETEQQSRGAWGSCVQGLLTLFVKLCERSLGCVASPQRCVPQTGEVSRDSRSGLGWKGPAKGHRVHSLH